MQINMHIRYLLNSLVKNYLRVLVSRINVLCFRRQIIDVFMILLTLRLGNTYTKVILIYIMYMF